MNSRLYFKCFLIDESSLPGNPGSPLCPQLAVLRNAGLRPAETFSRQEVAVLLAGRPKYSLSLHVHSISYVGITAKFFCVN